MVCVIVQCHILLDIGKRVLMAVYEWDKPWRLLCRLLLAIYGSRLCRWRNEFSMDGFGYADDGTRKVTTIGSLYYKTFGCNTDSKWIERCCFYDNLRKHIHGNKQKT